MQELNLPKYDFKIIKKNNKNFIFDEIRKKYISLTPEEWVRQNFIKYLVKDKKYPQGLISVEMSFQLNRLAKRSDIVIFNRKAVPKMIVECKAPSVNINQKVIEQIIRYNITLKVDYLTITNGLKHYCYKIDYKKPDKSLFIPDLPNFRLLDF